MKHALVFVLALGVAGCSTPSGSDAGDVVASDTIARDTIATDTIVTDTVAIDVVRTDVPVTPMDAMEAATDVVTDTQGAETSADEGVDAPADVSRDGMFIDVGFDASSDLCAGTGGTIGTARCCGSTNDFPSSCATGACGCSPSSSHQVMVCNCPAGQCFEPGIGCHTGG